MRETIRCHHRRRILCEYLLVVDGGNQEAINDTRLLVVDGGGRTFTASPVVVSPATAAARPTRYLAWSSDPKRAVHPVDGWYGGILPDGVACCGSRAEARAEPRRAERAVPRRVERAVPRRAERVPGASSPLLLLLAGVVASCWALPAGCRLEKKPQPLPLRTCGSDALGTAPVPPSVRNSS